MRSIKDLRQTNNVSKNLFAASYVRASELLKIWIQLNHID